jgi:predicted nuclease of predicted toxin-antitoxin system
MFRYLIDENLPSDLPFWNNKSFTHVLDIKKINSDTDIWEYSFKNELVILTKDSDFYYRSLYSKKYHKVVWIKTGNIKKKSFNLFIQSVWKEVEEMLSLKSFIIIDEEKIEGF